MTRSWSDLRNWRYHFAIGLHSNFPVCCILFFIIVWPHIWTNRTLSKPFRGAGYVRCPLCIIRRRTIMVRHCPCIWQCPSKEVTS